LKVYFDFDHEQYEFAATVRRLISDRLRPERIRQGYSDPVIRLETWKSLADLGLHGICASTEDGGLGLGWLDLVLPFEALGWGAIPGPYVETIAIAIPLLAALEDQLAQDWLAEIAAGELVISATVDGSRVLPYVRDAGLLLLGDGDTLTVAKVDQVEFAPLPSVDRGMPMFAVRSVSPGAKLMTANPPAEAWRKARDGASLATAAQLLGAGSRCLEVTRDYVCQRKQFGRPIGSFQAVQHLLVNAFLRHRFAAPLVHRAALSMTTQSDRSATIHTGMAKVAAARSATNAARVALQLHGAMGFTQEYELEMWLARVRSLTAVHGTTAHHARELASWLLANDRQADVGIGAPSGRR
jgi:alkylation response protein AidB-like acyl-CoA dehydrogenase